MQLVERSETDLRQLDIVKDDEWGLYPNFKKEEFACHHTGLCLMTHRFMDTIQKIRNQYDKPMIISSGYRDVSHPVERDKREPGEHTFGLAADIKVYGRDAMDLLEAALMNGIQRVGVSQKGDVCKRFIHIGMGEELDSRFPIWLWSY